MAVRLNLLDQFIEEMIVILPENLFQGLHAEQKLARMQYQNETVSNTVRQSILQEAEDERQEQATRVGQMKKPSF